MSRIETGVVQFGDDWPGVFIRGDNAVYYGIQLRAYLDRTAGTDPLEFVLGGLAELLLSVAVRPGAEPVRLKPAEEARDA